MLATLLLLAPLAAGEWVEISQHHYSRKPPRLHLHTTEHYETAYTLRNPFKKPQRVHDSPVTENYGETTTYYRKPIRSQYFPSDVTEVYVEESTSDSTRYRFKKPVRQNFHTTDGATEDYVEETTRQYRKPTRTHFFTDEGDDESTEFPRNRIYMNQSISGLNVWNKGDISKVPKLGNVQRVQLESNSVKAPNFGTNPPRKTVNFDKKNTKDTSNVKDFSEVAVSSEEILLKIDERKSNNNKLNSEFDMKEFKIPGNFRDPAKDIRKVYKTTEKPFDNVTMGTLFKNKPKIVVVTGKGEFDHTHTIKSPDPSNNIKRNPYRQSNVQPITKFTSDKEMEQIRIEDETPIRRHDQDEEVFIAGQENRFNNKNTNEFETKPKKPLDDDYATVSDDNDGPSVSNLQNEKDAADEKTDYVEKDQTSKDPSNESKANTLENLMTLMKVVADTISRNTRRSVNSKTKYLNNLKNTILGSIKEQIEATWPDDPTDTPRQAYPRTARAAQAAPRGHLEIPSSESALMTISFLTFAVFLIKLVLQIIQAYKNKTMMVTPAVVATVGRAAAAVSKRSSKP